MNNIVSRIANQFRGRTAVLAAILTQRKWSHRVGEIASKSPGGIFINDIIGNLDPLWWYSNPSLGNDDLDILEKHDYSSGDNTIPPMSSELRVSEFLAKWILLRNAVNVLEVGSFLGFTSAHMAYALCKTIPTGQLTCIDVDKHYLSIAEANVNELTAVRCATRFIHGNSLDPNTLSQLDKGYDLIFIDSAHDESTTVREIQAYKELLNPGGAMALHDAICWPGVRRAVTGVRDQFDSLVFATARGCGLCILVCKD